MKKKSCYMMLFFSIICLNAFIRVPLKKQGIEGYLFKVSGNQMPSPDIKPLAPKGMKGTLYIYALTNIKQTVRKDEAPVYSSVSTRLIKKIQTNTKGYFNIQLAPGKYSIFIQKDTVLYANRFDADNNIAPVEVLPGKMTKIELRMDYNAVY